ncbi:MAG: hypothetical protein V4611_03700 [Patescibacteria group bacterium]
MTEFYDSNSIPFYLEEATYDAVFDLMVNREAMEGWYVRPTERSFAGNMRQILSSVNPDLFLFTHKSAIPVADSVRGYYEELGVLVPDLDVINTKDIEDEDYTSGRATPHDVRDRELKRLGPIIEGRNVAIIDQYISGRDTITRAQHIASMAGATAIGIPDLAKWYHDAHMVDIDFEGISSRHVEHMRLIGRVSAQKTYFEVI